MKGESDGAKLCSPHISVQTEERIIGSIYPGETHIFRFNPVLTYEPSPVQLTGWDLLFVETYSLLEHLYEGFIYWPYKQ